MPEENKFKECQAKTSDGDSCKNPAIYPKEDPIACHIVSHQKQLEVYDEVPEEVKKADKEKAVEEEKDEKVKEVKNPFDNTKKHIFATKRLTHTVFVQYPKDDDRDFFRAEFSGGRWETDNDEKAKLLADKIKTSKALKHVVKKIQ